jgi:hypothetical protein
MNEEEILRLIEYLIGNITPIGDEAADEVSMQNIEKLISIMKKLHLRIDEIASLKYEGLDSKKRVIKLANDYLDWLGIEE